jgi:hypothetical protein
LLPVCSPQASSLLFKPAHPLKRLAPLRPRALTGEKGRGG